ncbi:MAG: hypothetical protein P4L26_10390 [Terracidiphilus sp.]|jgi:hypothetical protein|nr:hypothetical protein [Terracidiphilus sp.]
MDELLAGVLAVIAEVLFEAVFEITGEGLASLLTRAISNLFKTISDVNPIATTFALGMLGALAGFLSVVAYPHPLVHPSRFHGVSVIASPLIAGFVMSQLGRLLRKHDRRVMPIESFGYGFVFAFAMALLRFLMLR